MPYFAKRVTESVTSDMLQVLDMFTTASSCQVAAQQDDQSTENAPASSFVIVPALAADKCGWPRDTDLLWWSGKSELSVA